MVGSYLADRNILVNQPKDGILAAFGNARYKLEGGKVVKSREMYFAIYQALAEDERYLGLFKEFPHDLFDFIIVDECHRELDLHRESGELPDER
ncbi:MAG TPA: DEAD/DEAH box helicase family protein [Stellaceae bacterium]|nr:DEAD/DEAH box helicase family protein [Stellaceae bacterium]